MMNDSEYFDLVRNIKEEIQHALQTPMTDKTSL